jgi:prepilin-type N-terminal cleavage/methylation domain-containing protein/prepilin-type processing-associated H-X9-DG protein
MRHHPLHGKTSVHEPAVGVPKPSVAPASRIGGFTLTELLVVVAILAILAAIAIPFTSKAIDSSHRATCVTQLRQIGVATGSYLADNNNRLPGPIHANGQSPRYRTGTTSEIFSCLHSYLGLPSTNQWTAIPKKLCCPAFQRRNPHWNSNGQGDQGGRVYVMNQDQKVNGMNVFGRTPNTPPAAPTLNYSAVANGSLQTPLSKLPMIGDFGDVHGSVRNILFFDFHVEAMPLDYRMNNLP